MEELSRFWKSSLGRRDQGRRQESSWRAGAKPSGGQANCANKDRSEAPKKSCVGVMPGVRIARPFMLLKKAGIMLPAISLL